MTISVIIPTHNRAQLLMRLLNQLVTQTRVPDEIVIVDDHSTDSTAKDIQQLTQKHSCIRYVLNDGHYQRDAKKTGLNLATGDYLGFMDDDALIEDKDFFSKLEKLLQPDRVIQAKIILENMRRINQAEGTWLDTFTTRPYPLIETFPPQYHAGSTEREIFPLIEFGNFWPATLKNLFIDDHVTHDGYGESYSWSIRLWRKKVKVVFTPSLVIRHPGSSSGGSQRFDKKSLAHDFTSFHAGYFYNMIYIHARYYPLWVWLWLPYFLLKILIGVLINHNIQGAYRHGLKPIFQSLWKYEIKRAF